MKRFLLWVLIGAVAFGLIFFSLNLFDSRPDPVLAWPPVLAANLEPGNGFFQLWGLAEPAESDPSAPASRARMEELFNTPARSRLFRSRYSQWLGGLNASFRENWQGAKLNFPRLPEDDVCAFSTSSRLRIIEAQQRFAVPLRRYRQVLQAESLADFTPMDWGFPARSVSLAVNMAKLFAASSALAALDGDWQGAEDDLSAALEAGMKLIASGRTLTVNSLGKTMVELSLRTQGSLLNRGDCPHDAVRRILERMPIRPAREFGTSAARTFAWMSFAHALERVQRDKVVNPYMLKDFFREPAGFFALERFVAISGPRFFATVHALAAFFLKKNESVAALRSFWQEVGRLEANATRVVAERSASGLEISCRLSEPGPCLVAAQPAGENDGAFGRALYLAGAAALRLPQPQSQGPLRPDAAAGAGPLAGRGGQELAPGRAAGALGLGPGARSLQRRALSLQFRIRNVIQRRPGRFGQ